MRIEYKIEVDDKLKRFVEDVLKRYDTSKLDLVVFKGATQSHGLCEYPSRKRQRSHYNLYIWTAYKEKDGARTSWVDRGEVYSVDGWKHEYQNKQVSLIVGKESDPIEQEWTNRTGNGIFIYKFKEFGADKKIRIYETFKLMPKEVKIDRIHTWEELIVWIFGHEIYHWLRRERQVPGRNTQNQADGFGIDILREWRSYATA